MWLNVYSVLTLSGFYFVCANDATEFAESNIEFTSGIYREIAASSDENIIFSPIAVQTCLALALEGARGHTALELSKVLHLPPRPNAMVALKLFNLNSSSTGFTLKSSNKLYVGKNFQILPSFLNLARGAYHSDVENIEFSQNRPAAEVINQWVSSSTNGTIEKLIDPIQIDPVTQLMLINVIYFKGQWDVPFKSKNTHQDTFYKENEERNISMMKSVNYYQYLDSEQMQAEFLELKYHDSSISMTFVLPYDTNGLPKIENDIGKYLKYRNFQTEMVSVIIPKFFVENFIDFREVLIKLGIKDLFEYKADLTGITNVPGLFVKYVIQNAFLDVSEFGTEAAAATTVLSAWAYSPEIKPIVGGFSGTGTTTRYWDCCKPSCAWKENIKTSNMVPVSTCATNGVQVLDPSVQSGCVGGTSYMCNNQQPWQVNDTLGYGFAAASFTGGVDTNLCCACFQLDFTDQLVGKTLVLQVTNTGGDLGSNQFDIALPGGGVGIFTQGCHDQWNAPWSGWGDQYGGVYSRDQCLSDLPEQLQSGCLFRFDFMNSANNPGVKFTQVECPAEIVKISGCNLSP